MPIPNIPFVEFPKMARLSREIIITEKIDGTNAQVYITENGDVFAGSRTRWIVPGDDNFGFALWVEGNKNDLLSLGPGSHFGEWWGAGIQRRYNQTEKHFSLFNATRWGDGPPEIDDRTPAPECCRVVPVMYQGIFDTSIIEKCLVTLKTVGSIAAPGFMKPEGIVVFHTAGRVGFKKTIEKDDQPKGAK